MRTLIFSRRRSGFMCAAAAMLALAVWLVHTEVRGSTASAVTPCAQGITSAVFVPVNGAPLSDIRIDDSCTHVYVSNSTLNEIEVYSLQTKSLESPIAVGSAPDGFDITPDGRAMYVANSGGNNISVVDLDTKAELRKIFVPAGFLNDRPFSIAIANNGKAFFSTTFAGSGFGARMMQLDLATDALMQRTDFYAYGTTTEVTRLRASADRTRIAIVAGDISSGPVFAYTSAIDSFTPERDLNAFVAYIAADATGAHFLVDPGTYVLNQSMNVAGTVPGRWIWCRSQTLRRLRVSARRVRCRYPRSGAFSGSRHAAGR